MIEIIGEVSGYNVRSIRAFAGVQGVDFVETIKSKFRIRTNSRRILETGNESILLEFPIPYSDDFDA